MAELARRREILISRCARQRTELRTHLLRLETPLKVADRALKGMRYARRHPLLLAGAATVVGMIRGHGALRWLQPAALLWRAYRTWRAPAHTSA